jgi:hypothetical protein
MMNKRLRLWLVLVAVLGLGTFWLLRPTPLHRITEANSARIQEGMKESHVEAIFGVPEGTYTERDAAFLIFDDFSRDIEVAPVASWRAWRADAGVAFVGFDEKGEVVDKRFIPIHENVSVLERLRRWLGF